MKLAGNANIATEGITLSGAAEAAGTARGRNFGESRVSGCRRCKARVANLSGKRTKYYLPTAQLVVRGSLFFCGSRHGGSFFIYHFYFFSKRRALPC